MKLVAEKYQKLKPEVELLTDKLVISQAWKKTHGYMRTHNWYADTLALDISALGLESNVQIWAETLMQSDIALRDIELVPAAKSEPWILNKEKGWLPQKPDIERKEKPPLRPLAHMTVRDQTWATALMMCLADAVESAQGDCSTKDASFAQKSKVYSYGNRLHCDWDDDLGAWFRWGNGETYRKFFTDYQNFLKRPIEIGRQIANSLSDSDHVFIVNLDVKKFYDCIDRPTLLGRLKKISHDYESGEICTDFWSIAEKVTNWKWDADALNVAKKIGIELGSGLPQGLVASGFFANAYMIPFDKRLGESIGDTFSKFSDLVLHDYCRYVDDIRLVISARNLDVENIIKIINDWIGKLLSKHAGATLELNAEKTKITSLSDLDNRGSLSGRIALLQGDISGPADRDILENTAAVLEGLLAAQPEDVPEATDIKEDKALFRLVKFDHDIRLDTLKRFAANRLESVMRNKRKLTVIDDQNDYQKTLADNESELLAKKLVKAWTQDPSLGLVLRKAIEIYPSPFVIEPVLSAIFKRSSIGANKDVRTAAMMDYLLADIFRCCVDFNGFFQRVDFPKSASPDDMLDIAAMYAQKCIDRENLPKFIERQALLLLATLKKPVLVKEPEKTIQHSLHAILAGQPPNFQHQRLALFEVASQITGRSDALALLLVENISDQTNEVKLKSLEEIAKRGGEFWFSVWKRLSKDAGSKDILKKLEWAAPVTSNDLKSKKQKLAKVIASDRNGFVHEVALIKLALGLINFVQGESNSIGLSPNEIYVAQKGFHASWDELWLPDVEQIECTSLAKIKGNDPRFQIPPWVNEGNSENAEIYWIGSILRAAVVGGNDFTGGRWKPGMIVSYKGLRTGWYKRRMGMMHASEVLVGNYGTVSTWFSELLMMCLQWPGRESTYLQSDDILSIDNLDSLKSVLIKRRNLLNDLYCKASRMPSLVTSIRRASLAQRSSFRIVTVQQLLPKSKNFSISDPQLNLPKARAENRAHLARICQLTYKTLCAKLEADNDKSKFIADLIVFPEVAVHADDQDIIKRLADKTRSIVFAGMIFLDHDGKYVNVARWFIPDYRKSGRQWIIRDQGKENMTRNEVELGISGYRPCQHIIEVHGAEEGVIRIGGAICYDATDLNLAADLKKKTDLFVVCAHNKDVSTFDTMAAALNYHMYQHVVVVNKGEFGGSTIQAPYREHFDRLVSHAHGVDQISINVADLDLAAFRRVHKKYKPVKTKPAGI